MKKRVDDHREPLLDDAIEIRDDSETSSWSQTGKTEFNQWPHVFNLSNCIVGVSVLAMPYCLQQCGILLGTVLIALCSVLTKVTCHLLYKGAVITRRRSYEALALYAFGSGGRRVVEMLMLLFLMSSIVSFMVVIGDIGPHVLADYLQLQAPTQRLRILVMVFVFLFVIFPLSLIRNLDSLSVVSSVTVFFYFTFVVRMLVECVPRILDGKWSLDVTWWRYEGLLNTLPIISMALSCQTQMFCVADCIKDPATEKVDGIVSGAVNLCSAIYAAVGVFGYVAFHDKQLHGDILLYLNPSLLTQSLKLVFMLSIAVSVPLMLFPCRNACYNLFLRPSISEYANSHMPPIAFLGLTLGMLLIDLLVAILVPNVEFVLGLTGALIGSLVTIIIPSLLFIEVCPPGKNNYSLLFYAKLSVVIGALMLVGSTWAVLNTERQSTVVDVIIPKQLADDKVVESALNTPEKITVLNVTDALKSNELDEKEVEKKKEEMGQEARKILDEMKEQRKEQDKMIREQQKIVKELNEHRKMHVEEEQRKTNQPAREASARKREAEENGDVWNDGGKDAGKEGAGVERGEEGGERQVSVEDNKAKGDTKGLDANEKETHDVMGNSDQTKGTVEGIEPKVDAVPTTKDSLENIPVKQTPKDDQKPKESATQMKKSPQEVTEASNSLKAAPKANEPLKTVSKGSEQSRVEVRDRSEPPSQQSPQNQRGGTGGVTSKSAAEKVKANPKETVKDPRVAESQPSNVKKTVTTKKEENKVVNKRDTAGQPLKEGGKVEKREVKGKSVQQGTQNKQTARMPNQN